MLWWVGVLPKKFCSYKVASLFLALFGNLLKIKVLCLQTNIFCIFASLHILCLSIFQCNAGNANTTNLAIAVDQNAGDFKIDHFDRDSVDVAAVWVNDEADVVLTESPWISSDLYRYYAVTPNHTENGPFDGMHGGNASNQCTESVITDYFPWTHCIGRRLRSFLRAFIPSTDPSKFEGHSPDHIMHIPSLPIFTECVPLMLCVDSFRFLVDSNSFCQGDVHHAVQRRSDC